MSSSVLSISLPSKAHARRLRDIHRSAGWPSLDDIEIDLLSLGLIERVQARDETSYTLRLSDQGLRMLSHLRRQAQAALSRHEALVQCVARRMMIEGRLVWTRLSLRARGVDTWRWCQPDVFSIRHTSVAAYLQPIVHEIKVSRADLLSDLRQPDKRASYLDVGGQCWYVLGVDAKGRAIAEADEVPLECGVILACSSTKLQILRPAPWHARNDLPFSVWMSLARTPMQELEPVQAALNAEPS